MLRLKDARGELALPRSAETLAGLAILLQKLRELFRGAPKLSLGFKPGGIAHADCALDHA